jgi:hypothetical protein
LRQKCYVLGVEEKTYPVHTKIAHPMNAHLEWLRDNVLRQPRGAALSEAQLGELADMVRSNASLAHTVLTAAALTAHTQVVDWCMQHTAARPWVVARTLLCARCCAVGSFTLEAHCQPDAHAVMGGVVWNTAPLLAACCGGNLDLLCYWMREHAECATGVRDATLRDYCASTAVLWASRRGHGAVVKFLVRVVGCSPQTERDFMGNTALIVACARGHVDVARWLVLEAGACAKTERNKDDDTALTLASWYGRLNVVKWLITEAGICAKTERNKNGDTALINACDGGHLDVARWLVAHAGSCAPTDRNKDGETPLLLACHKGHLDVARWLLAEAGSSIDEKTNVRLCKSWDSFLALRHSIHRLRGVAEMLCSAGQV